MRSNTPSMLDRRGALRGALAAGAAALLPAGAMGADQAPASINKDMEGNISPVHDPCMIRAGDTYYVYSTSLGGGGQIPIRTSKDLRNWDKIGYVFSDIPEWARTAIAGTEGIWAPDISFVNGKYLLYYACSTFGKNRSAIGLATNTTLDPNAPGYAWKDEGLVFESRPDDNFNAIDPNHVVDRDGHHWLAFGSFWGGIKMIPLDASTGKPAPGDKRMFSLASRPPGSEPNAIEAPFVIERGGFYYLFCAFDFCCRGANSNYYTVVGRSPNVNGAYGDRNRYAMTYGNGTVVLAHDPTSRWRGPGGASVLKDGEQYYIVYHAYDARREGTPTLRIAPLVWSADGWPTAII